MPKEKHTFTLGILPLVPTNLHLPIAGPTVSIWRPSSQQLENGQPAIRKRSFEPGIRTFSFKQINKKNRVNASLSTFYASHCSLYHPEHRSIKSLKHSGMRCREQRSKKILKRVKLHEQIVHRALRLIFFIYSSTIFLKDLHPSAML